MKLLTLLALVEEGLFVKSEIVRRFEPIATCVEEKLIDLAVPLQMKRRFCVRSFVVNWQ